MGEWIWITEEYAMRSSGIGDTPRMRKRSLNYVRRKQAKWLEKFQKMQIPCRGCNTLVSHTMAKTAAEGTPYEHVCPECSEQTGYVTEIEFRQAFFLPYSCWELKEVKEKRIDDKSKLI